MSRRCIALLSGGLDSMLAIRLMQQQGIEVEALNFKTIFTCCQETAGQAARDLGVRITVVGQEDDYLELVKKPRFGYGKGANPCVDCRIYMFQKARQFMEQEGADFIISGEVVGQRPMSQKRRDLDVISYHAELEDRLLRPLSAKLLPPTLPERAGWVDRERLYGFHGRSRRELIELARELDLKHLPTPSTGCALTEPQFSQKVFDLVRSPDEHRRWDFELLKVGRHFRHDLHTKLIVGRNQSENDHLQYLHELPHASPSTLLEPENFKGPTGLLVGPFDEQACRFAGALILRYSRYEEARQPLLRVRQPGTERLVGAQPDERLQELPTLATPV